MDLRKLEVAEMGQISEPWVTTDKPVRTAIDEHPMLAAVMPPLTIAHTGIVAVSAQSNDPNARRLSAEENQLDAQHDDLVRTICDALTILAKVSKSGDELLRLRDTLFPDALQW
jgi:hypothetical protein